MSGRKVATVDEVGTCMSLAAAHRAAMHAIQSSGIGAVTDPQLPCGGKGERPLARTFGLRNQVALTGQVLSRRPERWPEGTSPLRFFVAAADLDIECAPRGGDAGGGSFSGQEAGISALGPCSSVG